MTSDKINPDAEAVRKMEQKQVKERPILFNGDMVRAILSGQKTQTRRLMKPQPDLTPEWDSERQIGEFYMADECVATVTCPYGKPGDRLWVREAHAIFETHGQHREDGERWGPWGGLPTTISQDGKQIAYYREGFDRCDPARWRPSIHMPRWASRITLEIVSVRVERLNDISEADAIAEGCTKNHNGYYWGGPHEVSGRKQMATAVGAYKDLWQSINGPESWDANPWVWVVEFKRVAA